MVGLQDWFALFQRKPFAIYKLQSQNKIKESIEIYRWFLPLLELDINPKLVQNIKLAETILGIGSEM